MVLNYAVKRSGGRNKTTDYLVCYNWSLTVKYCRDKGEPLYTCIDWELVRGFLEYRHIISHIIEICVQACLVHTRLKFHNDNESKTVFILDTSLLSLKFDLEPDRLKVLIIVLSHVSLQLNGASIVTLSVEKQKKINLLLTSDGQNWFAVVPDHLAQQTLMCTWLGGDS